MNTDDPELCATCQGAIATRGEYCNDCKRQHDEDQYWDNRMDWEREKELLED